MVYESAYDSGRNPYKPDLTRGFWAAPSDFVYTCISLGFRMDVISSGWFYNHTGGVIIPYIVFMFLFVMPIFVIQSFLGQFSSSGFISTFRISSMFKGIGYISVGLNLAVLTYYNIFVSLPLLYLFHSMRPTIPWSCEGIQQWFPSNNTNNTRQIQHFCNRTYLDELSEQRNTANATDTDSYMSIVFELPSVLFVNNIFGGENPMSYEYESVLLFSWQLLLCTLIAWSLISFVFYRFYNTELMSKFLRYAIWTALTLLIICLIRFMFISIDIKYILSYFTADPSDIADGVPNTMVYIVAAFGSGWGSIITLASFNRFKTNIMNYSWIICFGQLGIFVGFGILTHIIHAYFKSITDKYKDINELYVYVSHHWELYLSSGSVLAEMTWPNLWSIIYYTMLTLIGLLTMIISLFSIYQSIFDEFEMLRSRRTEVVFGLIGLLACLSMYTCSNHGALYFTAMSMDSLFTQTSLNLLLILVVLWIYGRVRFQRDIEFMLGMRFSTWKVNMLRFVAPICLGLMLILSAVFAYYEHAIASFVQNIYAVLFIILPWVILPSYMIYILLQTSGSIKMRLQRCCRPMDWYPLELEERQRYEEAMGNMDLTHQLNQIDNEFVS